MHPALRKGPLFLQKTPHISFPAYGPEQHWPAVYPDKDRPKRKKVKS